MSRGGRDPHTHARQDGGADRDPGDRQPSRSGRTWSPSRHLSLPRSPTRQPLPRERGRYRLRDSEIDLFSTVGAFRTVAVRDLDRPNKEDARSDTSRMEADIESLRDQGLLDRHTIVINGQSERVAFLTESGRDLLERSRTSGSSQDHSRQHFYGGLVKPRELAHDAQLYRMFDEERTELERGGSTVTRVMLDYELKAQYHAYVHQQEQAGRDADEARRTFAQEHGLPFIDGHIAFPDVRVEYETEDGLREYRDLELATEHYSRARVSGKLGAGFRVCRAGGSGSRRGGQPRDPHHLQWLA